MAWVQVMAWVHEQSQLARLQNPSCDINWPGDKNTLHVRTKKIASSRINMKYQLVPKGF